MVRKFFVATGSPADRCPEPGPGSGPDFQPPPCARDYERKVERKGGKPAPGPGSGPGIGRGLGDQETEGDQEVAGHDRKRGKPGGKIRPIRIGTGKAKKTKKHEPPTPTHEAAGPGSKKRLTLRGLHRWIFPLLVFFPHQIRALRRPAEGRLLASQEPSKRHVSAYRAQNQSPLSPSSSPSMA